MNRTGLLAVILFTALLFLVARLLPESASQESAPAPWEVTLTPEGSSQLLGITLGESTLQEAEQQWGESAKITLFLPPDGPAVVEGFFQRVISRGIQASIVVVVDIAEESIGPLFDRGARISTQGDGSRKVTLDNAGTQEVRASPIASLTYLPRADLSAEVIRNRFGPPTEIVPTEEGVEHWLYPAIGLDITLSDEEDEVLQFLPPDQFERLRTPLLNRP